MVIEDLFDEDMPKSSGFFERIKPLQGLVSRLGGGVQTTVIEPGDTPNSCKVSIVKRLRVSELISEGLVDRKSATRGGTKPHEKDKIQLNEDQLDVTEAPDFDPDRTEWQGAHARHVAQSHSQEELADAICKLHPEFKTIKHALKFKSTTDAEGNPVWHLVISATDNNLSPVEQLLISRLQTSANITDNTGEFTLLNHALHAVTGARFHRNHVNPDGTGTDRDLGEYRELASAIKQIPNIVVSDTPELRVINGKVELKVVGKSYNPAKETEQEISNITSKAGTGFSVATKNLTESAQLPSGQKVGLFARLRGKKPEAEPRRLKSSFTIYHRAPVTAINAGVATATRGSLVNFLLAEVEGSLARVDGEFHHNRSAFEKIKRRIGKGKYTLAIKKAEDSDVLIAAHRIELTPEESHLSAELTDALKRIGAHNEFNARTGRVIHFTHQIEPNNPEHELVTSKMELEREHDLLTGAINRSNLRVIHGV